MGGKYRRLGSILRAARALVASKQLGTYGRQLAGMLGVASLLELLELIPRLL